MEQFHYRILTSDHAERWQELRLESARNFPLGCLETPEETVATSSERCREILDGGGVRGVFVDDNLVGFCGYRPGRLTRTQHRGEIGPFFITQNHHGMGAADALMRGVVAEATKNGLAQLELSVDTQNLRAVSFYNKHGFEHMATQTDAVRIEGQSRNEHFYRLRLGH